jgi:hypothetical protein
MAFNINRNKYEKDINKWIALCRLSQAEREERQPAWDEIDRYFRGIQWKGYEKEGYDVVTVNLVYSHVKIVVPSTYLRYPKIYFVPQNPVAVDATKLLESVLNADMRTMKLKDVNKRIIQDVCLYGTGFSKTTFEVEGEIEPGDLEESEHADELIERFRDSQPEAIEGNLSIIKTRPHSARVSPRNLFFCVGATDINDPGFIGHWERKRVSSIKNNKYYKNTSDLQPTEKIRGDLRSKLGMYAGYGAEEYLDYVDIYEIWDIEKGRWLTIADGHGKYLVEPDDNPYLKCGVVHPFDKVVFTPLDDQMWGFGEIEPAMPQFDELNSIRSQQHNHRKRYNRRYLARENAFATDEDVVRLESGEDGSVVFVRPMPGQPLNEMVSPLQDASMPADVYRVALTTEDDIVKITRTTPYRRGDTKGANTATEANLAESAAEIGDSDRVDAMAEFTLSQLEKVRKMRAKLTIGEEMLDITGNPMDVERWKTWTRDDIDLESQMCIEVGSTRATTDESRKQDALLLYQNAIANPTVNPQAAFSKLLEAFGERYQPSWFLPAELIQLQMVLKLLGQQREQKGVSPMGGGQPQIGSGEPGPIQPANTPAEVAGRAAPAPGVAA